MVTTWSKCCLQGFPNVMFLFLPFSMNMYPRGRFFETTLFLTILCPLISVSIDSSCLPRSYCAVCLMVICDFLYVNWGPLTCWVQWGPQEWADHGAALSLLGCGGCGFLLLTFEELPWLGEFLRVCKRMEIWEGDKEFPADKAAGKLSN